MRARKRLKFKLQLLTPAYIGGAEPRAIDPYMPLRPTSIRGALRAWFRAAAAAILWPVRDDDSARKAMIDALRDAESAVFGDTEAASPFVVLPPEVSFKEERVPDPNLFPGLRYLGYGIYDKTPTLTVIDQGVTFDVDLIIRRDRPGLTELLAATVWLWTHVGGIGARSRRGFGSMCLLDANVSPFLDEPVRHPSSIPSLVEDCLYRGIDGALRVFETHLPNFTRHALYAKGAGPHPQLRTLDGIIQSYTVLPLRAPDGRTALDQAGRIFREYRSTLERRKLGLPPLPDYFAVKQSLQTGTPPRTLDRAAFGLPLSFSFRSLSGSKTTFSPAGKANRLPSPLLFRVHALGLPNEGRRVVTLFNFAQGEKFDLFLQQKIKQSRGSDNVPAPSPEILELAIRWMAERADQLYGPSRGRQ